MTDHYINARGEVCEAFQGQRRTLASVDRFRAWGVDNEISPKAIEFVIWIRRNLEHDLSEAHMHAMAQRTSELLTVQYQKGYQVAIEHVRATVNHAPVS